jgi:23S rRNA (adenine2503-C2)-methyltransferase
MSEPSVNLLGLPRHELEAWFSARGEKPFRARQLMRWLYTRDVLVPEEMTDLSLSLRESLLDSAEFDLPSASQLPPSADGTVKWLIDAGNGQHVEMVFIPEKERGTLCISSQVGCALNCSFCATGAQGFNRNLSAAEIVGQVLLARRELGFDGSGASPITNVVFMGMGEPLANFRAVVRAASIMMDDLGLGLSRRRVTISTSGIVPQIYKLAECSTAALAISLHAPHDSLRDELVPINQRHPIAELLESCWEYGRATRAKAITFEYVMLDGVNDSLQQAATLAGLLRDRPAMVNLIPFNPYPGTIYACSPRPRIDAFRQRLLDDGIMTVTRRTRGDDISAACGQLAGRVQNRVRVPLGSRRVDVTWQ